MKATIERYKKVLDDDKKIIFVAVSLKYEYLGYSGEYCYCIYTDLTAEELVRLYGADVQKYEPYLILTLEQYEARAEFVKNNERYKKRRMRREEYFGYQDGLSESVHHELQTPDIAGDVVTADENARLMGALDQLTPTQKRRVLAYFFEDKSTRKIAEDEGVNYSKVDNSIHGALKKLKKFLAQ